MISKNEIIYGVTDNFARRLGLRVCPREDQAEVTHATSPISLKLSQMIKVIKLFKNPK